MHVVVVEMIVEQADLLPDAVDAPCFRSDPAAIA
jgi:hypothetical protein